MNPETFDLETVRKMAIQQLESLERAGITHLPRPSSAARGTRPAVPALRRGPTAAIEESPLPAASGAAGALPRNLEPPAVNPVSKKLKSKADLFASEAAASSIPEEQRPAALQLIAREVAGCVRCGELASTRTQTVFGVGNPQARLCFLGEAPGADEDRQGEPFVGRAGQLLNKIIEACTLRREDVYILNTLKCRPPGNRNPLPDELVNCRGFLDRQLEIIRPEFICCLGAVAAKALLATEASIGKLRKRFFDYQGIQVICTYHPAYLLRNPAAKKDVWEDMQMLMREMGIALPAAKK